MKRGWLGGSGIQDSATVGREGGRGVQVPLFPDQPFSPSLSPLALSLSLSRSLPPSISGRCNVNNYGRCPNEAVCETGGTCNDWVCSLSPALPLFLSFSLSLSFPLSRALSRLPFLPSYAGTRWDFKNLNTPERRVGGAILSIRILY